MVSDESFSLGERTQSVRSFRHYAEEAAEARIMGGAHHRWSAIAGAARGAAVVCGAARLLRLVGLILAAGLAAPAIAGPQFVAGGYALSGYDAVAYHTSGRPISGDAGFILDWNGAVWRFASAANRDAFRSDPRRYGPAYDGHCAYAVSEGRKSGGVPELWYVADERLFLLCSKTAFETWTQEFASRVARADANWPALEGLPAAVPAQPVKPTP